MFNLGGKREKDPKKALENADKALNKGLSGALVKGFMGKEFTNEMNSALDMGKQAIEGVEQGQWLAQNGLDAEAEVVSVADTGQTINMNPVVVLQLKVTSSAGKQFDTAGQCMVSRIAVPRAGDKIKIKYNPDNPVQFTVV
jgi:hypothetical protein